MREYVKRISRSWIAIGGAVLATVSALLFLALFAIDLIANRPGVYDGLISFVAVPAVFVVGLLLIPLGLFLRRRSDRELVAAGKDVPGAPIIDFNRPRTVRLVSLVAVLTVVNFAIVAAAAYKGLEVMDSTEFCGTACHSVMAPEYTAYQRSPHSRVKCTECHIGGGASWFVKAKVSGSWQLISVALNLYPRPIPTPVHSLRPARETCQECHSSEKFVGDRLKIINKYAVDESQTASKTVLLMKVGGIRDGKGLGAHWHVDPNHQVRFRSDEHRSKVFDIEVKDGEGKTKLFTTDEQPAAGELSEWRTMECIDCHNRPTHVFRRPEREMDDALTAGLVDRTLPWVKREGLRVLTAKYASQEEATTGIREGLLTFYRAEYPELAKSDEAKILGSAKALSDAYKLNVWPSMNIDWGTYPSLLEHEAGCFRCHNSEHKTAEGKTVGKNCSTCHEALATEEEAPEVLDILYP